MRRVFFQWGRFSSLSAAEQRVLITAAIWLPVFWLCLRLLGLSRCLAHIQEMPSGRRAAMTVTEIHALGGLVNIAARHTLGPSSCLTRSVLLVWLLRRRGIESALRIGVRFTQGALDAHAWVEYQDTPVNDQLDVGAQFASFGDLLPLHAFHAP